MSAINEVIRILSTETGDYVNEDNVVTALQDMIDAGHPVGIDDGQGRSRRKRKRAGNRNLRNLL